MERVEQLVAVHARHGDVTEHDVEIPLIQRTDGFWPACPDFHTIAHRGEGSLDPARCFGIVIHYKHAHRAASSAALRRGGVVAPGASTSRRTAIVLVAHELKNGKEADCVRAIRTFPKEGEQRLIRPPLVAARSHWGFWLAISWEWPWVRVEFGPGRVSHSSLRLPKAGLGPHWGKWRRPL